MDRISLRRRKILAIVSVSALAIAALTSCSSEGSEVSGGMSSEPADIVSPTQPVDVPGAGPQAEVAPGINAPSNPVQPTEVPFLLRQKDLEEVTVFAQGLANSFLSMTGVFAPKPKNRPLDVQDLQFIEGLSAFALDEYYSWVLDEKTYRANADKVAGLIFIPPQNIEKRAYALPPVQQINYSNVKAEEGQASSVDGTPTIKVAFTLDGNLMWLDKQGTFWIAPISRDIEYVVAEQNEQWALDAWSPSKVQIGEARKAADTEVSGVQFSAFDIENPPDIVAPLPSSFPKIATDEGNR